MKWMPLILLTVAGFTFNTSEITPIGLLSDIAADFGVSEARAGLLISIYAWVVALLSLPLMLWCARMDFRKLLLIIVGVFLSATSDRYSPRVTGHSSHRVSEWPAPIRFSGP